MPSVISGDANVSATEFGYLDGVTSALQTQMDSKLNLAGGKILQIVRATDSTLRTTTSTSFVDLTGMSVTITPTQSTSAILLVATVRNVAVGGAANICYLQITDSSNNAISGAELILEGEGSSGGERNFTTMIAYATPATTSAVTYKVRFRGQGGGSTVEVYNNQNTGQMYALEISA